MYTNASETLNANAVSVTKSEKNPRHRNKQKTNRHTDAHTDRQTDMRDKMRIVI